MVVDVVVRNETRSRVPGTFVQAPLGVGKG